MAKCWKYVVVIRNQSIVICSIYLIRDINDNECAREILFGGVKATEFQPAQHSFTLHDPDEQCKVIVCHLMRATEWSTENGGGKRIDSNV